MMPRCGQCRRDQDFAAFDDDGRYAIRKNCRACLVNQPYLHITALEEMMLVLKRLMVNTDKHTDYRKSQKGQKRTRGRENR